MPGGPQFLPDPEDQEQPVVGARAEHQHDHQELGQRGDLQPVLGGLGDQRAGDEDRDQRRRERDQRERQRPEDQHQQHDDEQQREVLRPDCRCCPTPSAGRPGRRRRPPGAPAARRADRPWRSWRAVASTRSVDLVLPAAAPGSRARSAARPARPADWPRSITLLTLATLPQLALQAGQRGAVGRGQRAAGRARHHRDRAAGWRCRTARPACAACSLGALAGRNLVLLLWVTLDSDGSSVTGGDGARHPDARTTASGSGRKMTRWPGRRCRYARAEEYAVGMTSICPAGHGAVTRRLSSVSHDHG